MSRPRLHEDAATKQRVYRQRLKARRNAQQRRKARMVRDLHLRLQYLKATTSSASAAKLVGADALETLRNAVARLFEIEGI